MQRGAERMLLSRSMACRRMQPRLMGAGGVKSASRSLEIR